MKFVLTYTDAIARITDVLKAITGSDEWACHSQTFPSADYMDGQEPFLKFFDLYEGGDGAEWLGIMEAAVFREMRSSGNDLIVNRETIERIAARMASNPNIEMTP